MSNQIMGNTMTLSIFDDKSKKPNEKDLEDKLSKTIVVWRNIKDYVYQNYPLITEEWKYSGKKYGWSMRLKSKERTILYFIPCENYFKVAFVYGNEATEAALNSDLSQEIKSLIQSARVYAEGRGFRIDVKNIDIVEDIKNLIAIKMNN
jgi:hypothetical protein